MNPEELSKINRLTRRELTADEVYTFSVVLCDNDIDRDGECFSDEALEQLMPLYIGKSGIVDHNPSAENQKARIFDTELVTDGTKLTKYGMPYKYLKAKAYIVRTDENKNLIAEIDGGIKKEVSVSCSAASRKCSICGCDRNVSVCSHTNGERYDDKFCHIILDDITDAYEWSFVAVPAQINAGVTKKFKKKEEKSMDFTPISTQEEFDSAVQERVNAAVEEAKKEFDGWISPEAVAALTKERDDSKAEAAALAAKNAAAEKQVLKMQIANEKGIPFELAERLSGDTREEISKDADVLAKYFSTPKVKPTPKYSGESAFADSKRAAQLEMLSDLKNN